MWGERGKFLWIAQKHTRNTSCILSMVSAKSSYAMPLSTHGATGTGGGKEKYPLNSGIYKKDFIARSCVYSHITVVGKRENIQRIVDALQEMQMVMREIAGRIQSGDFSLSDEGYRELKNDYLALVLTVVDIADGTAYLFEKENPAERRNWKAELELEQYRHVLEMDGRRDK